MTKQASVPNFSPWLSKWFGRYLKRYFKKHFSAVRLFGSDHINSLSSAKPLILCANHPAWWDPILLMLIAKKFFPQRQAYGPMDAAAFERYPILGKLGMFPVEQGSFSGAKQFLQGSQAVLEKSSSLLGITVQGEFADARLRPIEVMAGLPHLLKRCPQAQIIFMAIEYPFLKERSPEAIIEFSQPYAADSTLDLAAELTKTLDQLSQRIINQDFDDSVLVVDGRKGVGWFYDALRKLRAMIRGERFSAAHETSDER